MRMLAVWLMAALPASAQTPPASEFAAPAPFTPDAATLKQIATKTADLKSKVDQLNKKQREKSSYELQQIYADVAVYWKAADWIVRHNEWYTKESGRQTLAVLDAGLERAKQAQLGKAPWREVRGRPVIRGAVSMIDDSVQPYALTLPDGVGTDGKLYRYDIVLHGRDASLTEVKFIASREAAKAKPVDAIIAEPYGRGNNAYRWAGEKTIDEMDALDFLRGTAKQPYTQHRVIRGFSMGGAGTWHIGLHHPFDYSAMAPGAGFTVTRGYVKNLPAQLPDYVERCLHIYDAADYAENAFNIPVIAYSGEKDPQIAAVRNVEARLKGFPEPLTFTHLVAPGLEHKMPPEWVAKANLLINKHAIYRYAELPKKSHFVTYYNGYGEFGHGEINGLERQYEKATVDSSLDGKTLTLKTKNVAAVYFNPIRKQEYQKIVVDGITLGDTRNIQKVDGVWKDIHGGDRAGGRERKHQSLCGPIDHAFTQYFNVVPARGNTLNAGVGAVIQKRYENFAHCWDKYLRGKFHINKPFGGIAYNEVLFGDPASNPRIAELIGKLPLKWTDTELEINGKKYDSKTHFPVMIYPHPLMDFVYVVLNSGHTFDEADFKGTNALLYPRLGDWAVMKLAPTKDDPHHTEVADAGIFDENWKFEKKK